MRPHPLFLGLIKAAKEKSEMERVMKEEKII
jgi:hypothetical protein